MKLFELFATLGLDTKEFDGGLDKAHEKSEGFLAKAGKTAAGAGKAIAVGLGAGAVAFGKLGIEALKLGGSLEQNLGGAEAVFERFAVVVERKGKEAFEKLGISTSDYLATANKMGSLFQGAGFSIDQSMKMSTDAMQRAADVASIMGIDTSAAMEAVAGAAKGNFTMMDNLGVAMNDTTLQAYALEQGLIKKGETMTQQQKIEAAMAMFMDKTAYAAGNYAKENDTLAGSLSTAQAAMKNFLDGSGDVDSLVAAFSNVADVVVKNIDTMLPRLTKGLSDLVTKLTPKIPPLLRKLLPALLQGATMLLDGVIAALPGVLGALADILPDVLAAIAELFPGLLTALIDGLVMIINSLASQMPTLIPIIIEAILTGILTLFENADALLEAGLLLLQGIVEGVIAAIPMILELMPKIIGAIKNALTSGLQALINVGANILAAIWTGITGNATSAQDVKDFFSGLWSEVAGYVTGVVTKAGALLGDIWGALNGDETSKQNIAKVFTDIVEGIKTTIDNIVTKAKELLGNILDALNLDPAAKENILAFFSEMWAAVVGYITGVYNAAAKLLKDIWNALFGDTASNEGILAVFSGIWDAVKEYINSVIDVVAGLLAAIWNALTSDSINAEGIKGFFSTLWNNIGKAATEAWDKIKGAIQGAIDKVKEFLGFNNVGKESEWEYYGGPRKPKATGFNYVPYDNYPANLHEGEAVLTKAQAREWRKGDGGSADVGSIVSAVTSAIVQAMSGWGVSMDGEPVGTMIAPYVSDAMGAEVNAGRLSTV